MAKKLPPSPRRSSISQQPPQISSPQPMKHQPPQISSPQPLSQQILVGSPQNSFFHEAVPWAIPSSPTMIIGSPPPQIASQPMSHVHNSHILVGSSLPLRVREATRLGLILDSDLSGRVFVTQILPNSIAQQSGKMKEGDELIEVQGLQHIHMEANQKHLLKMRLNRAGRTIDIEVPQPVEFPPQETQTGIGIVLGQNDPSDLASQIASPRPMSYPPQLSSLDMSFHRNRLGDWVGVPQGIGLSFNCFMGQAPLIAKVDPGSHAHHAGLLMGDRMLSVSATTTISTIRTEVKGFDAEQLIGLLRQTFDTASKCGGKMIFQVERFQDGEVKVLEKVFENMGNAPLQYVPSPNPTSQQILVGSPQNTYYQGSVPWTMPSMIISSPPPNIASPRPNYNSQISVGSQAGIGLIFGRGRYQPASSEYTWIDPCDQTGSLFIIALDPNGPAAKSGRLEPMQELIAIDGWSVDGQTIDAVSQRIRGKAGTPVTLQAFKKRQFFEVSVNREQLPASTTNFVRQMPACYQPSPYTGQYVGFVHVPGPERIVQVPVEVPVERIVYQKVEVPVERIVEVLVEVPVERIVYQKVEVPGPERIVKRVEVPVERIVEVPVEVTGPERVVVREVPPRRLCGVGLAVKKDVQNRCVVAEVLPDGPADGLVHEGDIILEIDHFPTERIPEGEASKYFLGDEFTVVTLTLTSDRIHGLTSHERRVSLERRPVQTPGTSQVLTSRSDIRTESLSQRSSGTIFANSLQVQRYEPRMEYPKGDKYFNESPGRQTPGPINDGAPDSVDTDDRQDSQSWLRHLFQDSREDVMTTVKADVWY